MYTIIVSILVGVAVGVGYTLMGWWKTWAMGIILAVLVAVTVFIIVTRVLAKKLEPEFLQAQKQIQSGASQLAIATLTGLLPMTRWQILLKGQIHAQLGLLSYALEHEDEALSHLEKAGIRAPEAQMTLAAILFRKKRWDKAKDAMDVAIKANKKQIMLYNVYAYMLNKQGEREAAIDQLQRCLKIEPSNESTKDNLLRLQNDRKMNMKKFGVQWYGLKLEKPPASMRQAPPGMRKGFRQKQRRPKGQ